jgi:hypothetical protein
MRSIGSQGSSAYGASRHSGSAAGRGGISHPSSFVKNEFQQQPQQQQQHNQNHRTPGASTIQTNRTLGTSSQLFNTPGTLMSSQQQPHTIRTTGGATTTTTTAPPAPAAAPMEATQRVMTVFSEQDKIAFACYSEFDNEIVLEQSHAHGHDTRAIIEHMLTLARPNLILIGNKIASNLPLVDMLTTPPAGSDLFFVKEEEQLDHPQQMMPTPSNNSSTGSSSAFTPGSNLTGGTMNMNMRVSGGGSVNARPASGANAPPTVRKIPFKILKSSAFDLRNCTNLILNNLRVLTLLRQNQQHQMQLAAGRQGQGGGGGAAAQGGNPRDPRPYFLQHPTMQHSVAPLSYHSIAAIVDLHSSPVLVRALGALLSHLQSTIFRLEEGQTVTVNSVNHAKSELFMRIDTQTLQQLHIFATEHHPLSMAKGAAGTSAKEGFSLFALLDRCKSKLGQKCLREWMVKPTLDLNEIQRRQDGIELCLQPEVSPSVGLLLNLLSSVGAIDKILLRMQKVHTAPKDFLVLSSTLKAAVAICSTLEQDFQDHIRHIAAPSSTSTTVHNHHQQHGAAGQQQDPSMQEFARRSTVFLDSILERCFVPALKVLYDRITSIIDEERTAQVKDAVVIQYGFHPALDDAKEAFEVLDGKYVITVYIDRATLSSCSTGAVLPNE